MKTLIALIFALALTGCASNDYAQYAQTQQAIAAAKGQADAARYRALADIAASGDSAARVAAVMALALGQGGASPTQQIAAPAPNAALQWASILLPSITQIYGIRANADVAMRSSDNAASTSIATTGGFVAIAGQLRAPNVSTVTTTTTDRNDVTTGAVSNVGAVTTTTTDRNDVTTGAVSNVGAVTTTATDRNDVTSTVSSTSTVGANSGANSGNSGRLAGGYITDSTSAPTVVTQPSPVIVTQPQPLVLTQPSPVIVNPVIVQPAAPLIVNPVVVQPAPPLIVRPEVVRPAGAAP